ncbi:MAG: GTP-binding protein [Gemmatimonadetes bacterium]|nr:GTP-binding protein [Gemmatimonadota bacterium]
MIQKKVCMVGVFGTGKTSLVQQFVHTKFTDKYHSTVGVKIDRKVVNVAGTDVTLVLWDLAGRDSSEDIGASYLKGAHGIIYVGDGTRRDTVVQLDDLLRVATAAAGAVPSVTALNKIDLTDQWALSVEDYQALVKRGGLFRTSAKTGEGVEAMFLQLATWLVAPKAGA